MNVKNVLLLVSIGIGLFSLSVDNVKLDKDEYGFQPEIELRHILKDN